MIEYEKKILLTENEYQVLKMTVCKNCREVTQTNYYFDTADFLMNKKGITCRIRAKNGKFTAEVKNHNIFEKDGSNEEKLFEGSEFCSEIFTHFGLFNQGSLITQRTTRQKGSEYKIVLDRNTYLGKTDYELEIEYFEGFEKEALQALENIAKTLFTARTIEDRKEFFKRADKSKSKAERFFEEKIDKLEEVE